MVYLFINLPIYFFSFLSICNIIICLLIVYLFVDIKSYVKFIPQHYCHIIVEWLGLNLYLCKIVRYFEFEICFLFSVYNDWEKAGKEIEMADWIFFCSGSLVSGSHCFSGLWL